MDEDTVAVSELARRHLPTPTRMRYKMGPGQRPGPILRSDVSRDAHYAPGVASGLASGVAPSPSTVKGWIMPCISAGMPVSGSMTHEVAR